MSIEKLVDGEKVVFANKSVIDHSQLSGTQSYGCHPISAIRKLPEKLTKLKENDVELKNNIDQVSNDVSDVENRTNEKINNINTRIDNINTKISELDISQLQDSIKELGQTISNVENNASKIDIVDNKDTTLTFTNYNGEQKTIQTGALPDDESLTLENNKITLKQITSNGALNGNGTKKQPLKINTDNKTIKDDGTLKAIALDNNGEVITGSYISSEITSLNKDIGDLTDTLNNDKKELDAKNLEQDNLIKALQNKTSGLGGYLTAYNFKKNEPTQEELTNYALDQLNLTNKKDIPDQTRVKNLYDDNVWILNNHTQGETEIFNWINDGSGEIAIATDTTLGVVKGSTEDYEGSVDVAGHITINGLEEFISNVNATLLDTPSLNEENTFKGKNNFDGEVEFNTPTSFNDNINLTNALMKILRSINNSDIVTQYDADKIIIEKNGVTYTINLPTENGTLITDNKFNPKYSKLKNEDTQTEKIDSWTTDNIDAVLSIKHQNGNEQTELSVSKGYGEFSSAEQNQETGKFNVSRLTLTSDTFTINVSDGENNQTITITPEEIKVNNDDLVTLDDLNSKLSLVANPSSLIKVYAIAKDGQQTLISVDEVLDNKSENLVQNKVITEALEGKINKLAQEENNRVYIRATNGEDTSLPFTYSAEASSIAMRSPSGSLAVGVPTQNEDAVNKEYLEENYQGKITPGNRIIISKENKLDVVTNYIQLSGESGELHEDEYSLIQRDPMTVLKYGSNYYRCNSEPINGHGSYVFFCDNYSMGEIKELKPYVIIVNQDKTWEWKVLTNFDNSVQYVKQDLTQEQKDQACENLGINNNNFVTIEVKEGATNGVLSTNQMEILESSNTSYIILDDEKYDKQDIKTSKGYLAYTHNGHDSTNNFFTKCITITLSTRAWVLMEQSDDDMPTENSKNLITSGGVFKAFDNWDDLKANADASNIDSSKFFDKLNINQVITTMYDGTTIIKFGNIMIMYKLFSMTGNTSQTFTFPYSFDNGTPMCWCNSTADGSSSNNSVAVTTCDSGSMTARICGADSNVTMFAVGWNTNPNVPYV